MSHYILNLLNAGSKIHKIMFGIINRTYGRLVCLVLMLWATANRTFRNRVCHVTIGGTG